MAKLGDICFLKAGKGMTAAQISPEYSDAKYPCYGGNGIRGYVDKYTHDGEYVLIGRQGALCGNVQIASGKFYATEHAVVATPLVDLDTKWLYNALLAANLNQYSTGAAQPGLNIDILSKVDIQVPDLPTQRRIATTLNKVSEGIVVCRQMLADLDAMVKARFVEMFSTCTNIRTVNDICSIITDGTHQPPRFQQEGIPFIFVSNIVGNKVTYEAEKFISQETYDELIKRTPIEIGDVLLSTVGSYGHPAVVTEDTKFLFQRHIAYLKPKHELIDSFYLHSALLSPDVQKQIEGKVKGIAQKTLNLSEIRSITIPVPEMIQQTAFAAFVNQIDKSKVIVQQQLAELETLKKSLMQEYFG